MVSVLAGVLVLANGIVQADVYNMPTGQTSLQFVTVGNPGNTADTAVMTYDRTTGYGSVPYVYQMGKYDVTVGQYCQFLNAVAKTDTYGLYCSRLATEYSAAITQSGSPGSYSYSVTGSYGQAANCPIMEVSWGDAARFCNWLAKRPADRTGRAGYNRDRLVHPQRRGHGISPDGGYPQRRSHVRHTDRERMVQGGVLQRRRYECRLLDVSHSE